MKACSSQRRQSAKLFSSRRNWDSHTPSPAGENAPPPPLWFRGDGHTRWRERGWESPNSDDGTYTVVLWKYMYFVMQLYTVFVHWGPEVGLHEGDLGAALLLVLRDEVDGVERLQGQLVHWAAAVQVLAVAVPASRVAATISSTVIHVKGRVSRDGYYFLQV